jgi:hypothetical protein
VVLIEKPHKKEKSEVGKKTKKQTAEKKAAPQKRERSRLDVSFQVGLNLLSDASAGELDFLSPVADLALYLFPLKWLGVGFGVGFIYATTTDPDFGWIWTYDEETTGHNFIMPLYGSFKFRFGRGTTVIPYAKLDLGYAFWWPTIAITCADDRQVYYWGSDGGFLKGLGAGVDFGFGLNLEVSLLMFTGSIETKYKYSGYTYYYRPDVDFTFINFAIGYTF